MEDEEIFERMIFEMEAAGINVEELRIGHEIGELTGSLLLTNINKEDKELFLQRRQELVLIFILKMKRLVVMEN